MNPEAYKRIAQYRIREGYMGSTDRNKNNGVWLLHEHDLRIISSDKGDWDHVSVSLTNRIPTWDEMCFVKRLFWLPEETAMQLHPPEVVYVNQHPNVLHLWKPHVHEIPLPPIVMV